MNVPHVIKTPDSDGYLDRVSPGSRVLLVSDIVLTGTTGVAIRKAIEEADAKVVGALAILTLRNSVKELGQDAPVFPLCELRRSFYETPATCPLCRCEYPQVPVNALGDFRRMPDAAHPYDFWEAVQESRSFSHEHRVIDGRHFTYYIRVDEICTLYADPIARQLLHQARNTLAHPASPKFVVYPDSAAGKALAEAVGHRRHIPAVAIPRDLLTAPLPAAFAPPAALASIHGTQVIVVDDLCSTLKTIRTVDELLQRVNATPIAHFVALNRSTIEVTQKRQTEFPGKFHFYYHWPVAAYRNAAECPECSSQGISG